MGVRQGCTWVCGRGIHGCAAGVYMGVRQGCIGVCGRGVQGCIWVCGRGVQGCAAEVYMDVAGVTGVWSKCKGVCRGCRGVQGCAAGVYRGVQQGCTGQGCAVYRSAPCVYEESTADRFLHIARYIMLMSGSSRRIYQFYQQKLQVGFLPGEKQEPSIIICPV